MIPRVIHYIWFGGKPLPLLARRCIDSWQRILTGFEIRRWSEDSIASIQTPTLSKLLHDRQWAFASDYARLALLKSQGGVYLDVDIEAIRSVDDLCLLSCFLGYEEPGRLNNAVLGAEPNHPFVARCLEVLEAHHRAGRPPIYSPELTTNVYREREWPNVSIFPEKVFYPYNPFHSEDPSVGFLFSDVTSETRMAHHWAKSWSVPLWQRVRRKLGL